MLHSALWSAAVLHLLISRAASQCFFRDGGTALGYTQCPGSDWCCKPTDTCVSNGLCRDINNHDDGSLTTLSSGTFNFTGLYQTTACTSTDWTGCQTECSSSQSSDGAYIWACDDQLTEYCCLGTDAIGPHRVCCNDNTQFTLDTPTVIPWSATSSSTSSSATTSTSQTSTSSSSSTTSTLSTTTETPSSTVTGSSTPPPDPGLSQGAKIGIGVGVGVGVLTAIIVSFLIYRVRNLQSKLRTTAARPTSSSEPKYQIAPQYEGQVEQAYAISGKNDQTYYGRGAYMGEMDSQSPAAEMEGDFDQQRTGYRAAEMP